MIAQYTNFCLRQFDETFTGTKLRNRDKNDLLESINKQLNDYYIQSNLGDFCIYVPILNTYDVMSPIAPISSIKKRWINTKYDKRTEHELPILMRSANVPFWFKAKKAKFLIAVLYSRQQLREEHEEIVKNNTNVEIFELRSNTDFGIVTILTSESQTPDPMTPITMMRNALGKAEGGNGVKLNKMEYIESVNFWDNHILYRKTNKLF